MMMRLCNNALFDTEKGVIEGENSLFLIEIYLITMGWFGPTLVLHPATLVLHPGAPNKQTSETYY